MTRAVEVISWIEAVGYLVIALITGASWLRHRTLQQGLLVCAIGLLGALSLLGPVEKVTGYQSLLLAHLTIPAFLASGYVLALFRHSVIRSSWVALGLLFALLVAVSAGSMAVTLPTGLTPPPTFAQWALVWGLLLLWCGCVAEPAARFWLASRGRPILQRARLRALSAGYGALVVLLLASLGLGIVAGPELLLDERYRLTVSVLGAVTVPLLYIGFAPPRWLRRLWRDREESALRRATAELLLATDTQPLADNSLDWALRLVGADRGLILGPGRQLLASRDIALGAGQELATLDPGTRARLVAVAGAAGGVALVAPLPLPGGPGMIVVVPGAFTPVFGGDEVTRLGEYAISVAAALERAWLIDARAHAEQELIHRARELERSNAALEEFAYVASHDLQEPLRMVASYLELLDRRYSGRLDSDADDFLGFAVDGAKRMQALINDLLRYSRAGGQGALEPTDCDAVLETVRANLRSSIEESGARLLVDPLPAVRGDATQLAQVFQNLIANAIKFRGEGPPEIRIGAVREAGQWTFSVRDNGIGIEPRHAERIFMVFKRLHPQTRYPGTGIGLAICRRVIERHGGRIWVEPTAGGGSEFRFTLPAAVEAHLPQPRVALAAGRATG